MRETSSRQQAAEASDGPLILFDGVCNLCNGAVNFVIDRDPAAIFRFASLQSDEAKPLLKRAGLRGDYLDSLVLLDGGSWYRGSDAVLRIAWLLGGWCRLLSVFKFVPRVIRDRIYQVVARHRYEWFGKRPVCRVPTPELQRRFL